MKIVEVNGGLGNQMCQYVFARFLEIYSNENVWFDLMSYDSMPKRHNGFELKRIFKNVKIQDLRGRFELDVWLNMINICKESNYTTKLYDILNEFGLDLVLVGDEHYHMIEYKGQPAEIIYDGVFHKVFSNQITDPNCAFFKELEKHKNVYFGGVWSFGDFVKTIKKEIEHELDFPELESQQNIQYKDDILSKEISVGLHIRRGDFISLMKNIDSSVYAKAIKNLKFSLIKNGKLKPAFYIFSDDIEWCKENYLKELGFSGQDYVIFIEGNELPEVSYIDMQLMTFCDYLIHDNESSFCLGAVFASKKNIIRIPCKR